MGGLAEKTDEAKGVMDEFGNFLESFDDWVDRLAKEEKQRQEEATKKLEEEKEKQKTILERFAEVKESIADRTYELTHTAMEKSIRDLNKQKEAYLAQGQSQKEVDKWYQAEIDKLNELHPIKDEAIKDNKEIGDGYKDLGKDIDDTTKKLKEAGEVGANAGKQIADSLSTVIGKINTSTQALSNFTKAGVAAAIATIKMKFIPLIKQAVEDLNWAKTHFDPFWGYTQMHLNNLTKQMNNAINSVLYGFDVYNRELEKLGGTTEGATNSMTSSWNNVTNAANETAEAIGEAADAISAPGIWGMGGGSGGGSFNMPSPSFNGGGGSISNQSTTNNNSWSPSIVVNVAGNGNVSDIKRAVQEALNESNRQYFRQGKEILLGA